jgi:hypothetical protein
MYKDISVCRQVYLVRSATSTIHLTLAVWELLVWLPGENFPSKNLCIKASLPTSASPQIAKTAPPDSNALFSLVSGVLDGTPRFRLLACDSGLGAASGRILLRLLLLQSQWKTFVHTFHLLFCASCLYFLWISIVFSQSTRTLTVPHARFLEALRDPAV